MIIRHNIGPISAAKSRPLVLGHVSLLPRQTILEVRKPEFGTALARCCAQNKCWRPEFGPALAAKCIPELSFQQRHDIGSRSSANFWRCWASVGPYLISRLGCYRDIKIVATSPVEHWNDSNATLPLLSIFLSRIEKQPTNAGCLSVFYILRKYE